MGSTQRGLRGLSAQNIWRMRQFDTVLFERVVLSPAKVSPLVTQIHPGAASMFKDSYLVEFLDLPATHLERDLQWGPLAQLRQFLLELGRDFCFLGSEYASRIWCSKKIPVSTSWRRARAWARPSQKDKKEEYLSQIIYRLNDVFVTDQLTDKDMVYAYTIRDKVGENNKVMMQIENNSAEQALLGDFSKAIDDAIMDSSEAHQNQMMQLLADPSKAANFARIVFDLLVQGQAGNR